MCGITVIVKKWFDKVNGNSYYNSFYYLAGKLILTTGLTYGYERQYITDTYSKYSQELYTIFNKSGEGTRLRFDWIVVECDRKSQAEEVPTTDATFITISSDQLVDKKKWIWEPRHPESPDSYDAMDEAGRVLQTYGEAKDGTCHLWGGEHGNNTYCQR